MQVVDVAGGTTPGYRTLRRSYAAGARAAAPWCTTAAAVTVALAILAGRNTR